VWGSVTRVLIGTAKGRKKVLKIACQRGRKEEGERWMNPANSRPNGVGGTDPSMIKDHCSKKARLNSGRKEKPGEGGGRRKREGSILCIQRSTPWR